MASNSVHTKTLASLDDWTRQFGPAGWILRNGLIQHATDTTGQGCFAWNEIPTHTEIEVLLRGTSDDFTSQQIGAWIAVAGGDADFTGYWLTSDGDSKMNIRRYDDGAFTTTVADTPGTTWTAGTYYWMRFRMEQPTAGDVILKARQWEDGDVEPGVWTLNESVPGSSDITSGATAGLGHRWASGTVSYSFFGYATDGETVADEGLSSDYVRMSVQEDAGSILKSTQAIPSEVSASIALEKGYSLERGVLSQIEHPLDPGLVLFCGYPHDVPNAEHLNTYVYETKIGRMARTFPPKLWERVDKIAALASDLRNEDGDLDAAGDRVTAQAALQYIFDQWAATYTWFSADAVPDLRTWSPSEDYSGTNGIVYVLAVRIRQEQNRRKSMLDILREWLSPFPITPRQNSAGNIELRPQHGPDADAAPTRTLTDGDIVWPGLSDGGADERFAKNLVRVTNQGDIRSEDVQVMESAWLQVASSYNFGSADVLYTPPLNVRNLSYGTDADGNEDQLTTAAHGLTANVDPFCAQRCSWFWAVGADSIPAGDEGILLASSSGTKQITAEYIAGDSTGGIRSSGTVAPSDVEVNTIPYSGETVDAIVLTHVDTRAVIRGRWDEQAQGVFLSWGGTKLETSMALPPRYTWTFGINLQDASVGITEGPVESATVGTTDDSGEMNATIPGTDPGTNAIVQSQAANGINEANIDIRVYTLEPSALVDIGLGYLRDNIDPRVIRTGEQSPENGMPIVPDDIGHLVQLGDGSEAIVLSCGYQMDFSPGHGSPVLRSPVRFLVVSDPVIDTTTTFLHFADGSYFELADGTISEEA